MMALIVQLDYTALRFHSMIFIKTDAICKGLVRDKFVYKFILPFKTNETLEKDERETVQR